MTQTISTKFKVEADGHLFTECPRWHAGALYFSDIHGQTVYKLSGTPQATKVVATKDRPAGLGFMPNGDLLIVQMHETKLLRLSADGTLREHADLKSVARYDINDMVVDRAGRAYVSQFGYDWKKGGATATPSPLVIVEPDGRVHASAQNLMVANGIILSADGKTLLCAEPGAGQISAFDVASDGSLTKHRVFAKLPKGYIPDGICFDEGGGVWAACCFGPGFVRVTEGGTITHEVPVSAGRFGFACALGGPGRRTLYMCTAESHVDDIVFARRSARIESVPVDIAGAGIP